MAKKVKATRVKRAKFVPKPKKTLIPQPNWSKLEKATTEDARMQAWLDCDTFVHCEVSDKEYLHSMKKWLRKESGWGVDDEVLLIPDTFLVSCAKHGWKAIRLGYMPVAVRTSLYKILMPLLKNAQALKDKVTGDPLIHPTVSDKDEDHALYLPKVKEWIVSIKQYLKASKHYEESSDASLRMQYQIATTYLYNLAAYMRTGVWLDSHYGEKREYKQVSVCIAPSYHPDGTMKRTIGVHYPDVGAVWTREMEYPNEA